MQCRFLVSSTLCWRQEKGGFLSLKRRLRRSSSLGRTRIPTFSPDKIFKKKCDDNMIHFIWLATDCLWIFFLFNKIHYVNPGNLGAPVAPGNFRGKLVGVFLRVRQRAVSSQLFISFHILCSIDNLTLNVLLFIGR